MLMKMPRSALPLSLHFSPPLGLLRQAECQDVKDRLTIFFVVVAVDHYWKRHASGRKTTHSSTICKIECIIMYCRSEMNVKPNALYDA